MWHISITFLEIPFLGNATMHVDKSLAIICQPVKDGCTSRL